MNHEAFGLNLRMARRAAKIHQADLAKQLGLARTTLIAIEQGQRKIRPWDVVKAAEILGMPAQDLIPPDAPAQPPLLVKGHYAFLSDAEFDLITAYRDNNLRSAMEILLKSG